MSSLHYNDTEKEAIVLKAVWDLIQDSVNYGLFCYISDPADAQLTPKTSNDLRLFNILVGDFLAAPKAGALGLPGIAQAAKGSQRTYLAYLQRVTAKPQLSPGNAQRIRTPTRRLSSWLDADFTVKKVWLANVGLELDMTMTRLESIKICSNIAKHNFSRLTADVGKIRSILKRNGKLISEEQAYIILPDFYAWFHTNIFAYHTTHLAELLNNVLWGIDDYLRPEYARAYRKTKPSDPHDIHYSYDVPASIQSELPRTMYWDLMNDLRRGGPHIPRFRTHWSLRTRY